MTNAATKPRADGWQKLFRRKLLRNELIGVIVFGVLFAFNFPASAQQQKKNTKIGFIGVRPDAANYSAKFIVRELENLGYVEGNGFHFEYRTADNQIDRLPDLVDQLIRLKIDVLITAATPETKMAQKATKDIPIVSLNLGDPVVSGLVNSMARPGGNVTGFTPLSVELTSKRLELLKESIPKISRVAVIFNPETTRPETWKPSWGESQRVAKQLGLEIRSIEMKTAGELDGTFADIIKARTNGLVVSQSALTNSLQRKIVKLAATHKLPTIYPRRDYAESGGLMSYGADRNEAYTRVAIMVDKILKGTKPAAIPVEQASKFELICNLKTAKQIGVTIPPNVLARADRVIR